MLDARYNRDNHKSAIFKDSTMYPTASKNGEDPSIWSHGTGNVNAKNDIVDFYAHYRRNGTSVTDSLWLYGSITTIDNTGARYNDFEVYRTDLNYDQSTGFTGVGPDSGHLSWTFDSAGNVTRAGDMIVATSYNNSGLTSFEVRIWVHDTSFTNVTPAKFTWGSDFDGDGVNAKFGYATVLPLNPSAPYYISKNNTDTTRAAPWQTLNGQTDSLRTTYMDRQCIEFGVNLSLLGLDPASISGFNAACDDISLKLMCKSRSSGSFVSQLQDFGGPVPFGDFPEITSFSTTTYIPMCDADTTKTLIAKPNLQYDPNSLVYQWNAFNGGSIVSGGTNDTVVVGAVGTYVVTITQASGCNNAAGLDTFYVVNDADCDGLVDLNDVDDDDDGILDVKEVCGPNAIDFSCVGGDPGLDADGDDVPNYRDSGFCTLNSKGVCASLDFDGDGIINQYDRDSDNDGIPDIIEAGGIDANGDGKIDTLVDSDLDGIMDKYDYSCTGQMANGTGVDIEFTGGSMNNVGNIVDNDSTTYGSLDATNSYVVIQLADTVLSGTTIYLRVASSGATNTTFQLSFDSLLLGKYTNVQTFDVSGTSSQLVAYTVNTPTNFIRVKRTSNTNATRIYYSRYSFLECNGNRGYNIANPDFDGDGTPNFLDLDADNDGIPDLVEAGGADDNNDGMVDDYNPATGNFTLVQMDNDGYSSWYDSDTMNTGVNNAQTISGGLVTKGPLVLTGQDGADNNGRPNSYTNGDPDGDIRLNAYDLDSDNDGVVDLVEVGGTDSNRNGTVDSYSDADGDGWNNTQDGYGTSSGNTPLITPATDSNNDGYPDGTNRWTTDNSDTDKFANFIDIDSDGDGITDNTEAQATSAYVAPGTTDANNDGLLDAYGTTSGSMGLVPVNTDSTDNADYLDLDSDNDNWSDLIEGHDTNGDNVADTGSPSNNGTSTGTDSDNDGLDDGFDNNTASFNPTNGSLEPLSHPNVDLSATTQRDWREPVFVISGVVFDDKNGLEDNLVNGTGIDNPGSFTMYVYLVDSATGRVIRKDTLNSGNGSFEFTNLNPDTVYFVRLSTQNVSLYSIAPTSATLPTNWTSVGENFGSNNESGTGNETGTPNSDIKVSIGSADVTSVAIGIDARPEGIDKTASSQLNPGGTTTVQTPSLAATDFEQTTIGTGGRFIITTLPTNGTLYYNGSPVSAGDTLSNYDSTLLQIDPSFHGAGTVTFNFRTLDSALVGDSLVNTITLPFLGLDVTGTLYDDADGLQDNLVDGTAFDNPASATLYVYLVDSISGLIIAKDTLNNGNGTYSFMESASGNTAYNIQISSTNLSVGASGPSTAALPTNWVSVGENYGANNSAGSGNESGTPNSAIKVSTTTSDVSGVNFAIDARPEGIDKTAASQVNPGGTTTVQVTSLAATDLEQTTIGTGGRFIINTLPVNGTLRYNGVALSLGDTISNYDSTLFTVDPTFNGSGTVSFTFTTLDNALVPDSIPNTITMPFISLTISGTLLDDRGGNTDGDVNGVGIDNPGSATVYAYLIEGGNIIGKDTLNSGNGTYTFIEGINGNTAYSVMVSTQNLNVGAAQPSATNWPTNWVSTGEEFGTSNSAGTGLESGTANGLINVTTAMSNVTEVNFGIDERPAGTDKTAASQPNPGGTNTVQVVSLAGTDPEDGSKGQGSTFIINTVPGNGTLYYNSIAVSAGDTIENYDSTLLTVDPGFNGAGNVSFTFTVLDSALVGDSTPNTITMPFISLTISGTLLDDRGGNTDGDVNGVGIDNPGSATVYAYLIEGGNIIGKDTLNSGNGTYTFIEGINGNTAYSVMVSTQNLNVGAAQPSATNWPTNWVSTGEEFGTSNSAGTGLESGTANGLINVTTSNSNVTEVNFGIDERPAGTDKTAASQPNPGGTNTVQVVSLAGTDPEDGNKGQGSTFIISTVPGNGTLYYNSIAVSAGDTIENYDSTLFTVDPSFNGPGSVTFTFTVLDSALVGDSTPNTIVMPFSGLTISGILYHDYNGTSDGAINGTAIDNPAGTTTYVYLVNGSNTIIAKDTLNSGNGTYSFNNIADANTAYTVKFTTENLNVGATGPVTSTWPTEWRAVGEQYGSNNNAGSGIEGGTSNSFVAVTTGSLDVSQVNAGIEQRPEAHDKSYSSIDPRNFPANSGNGYYPYRLTLNNTTGGASANSDVTLSDGTLPGRVSGTDPEEGNYAGASGTSTRTFVLATLPDSQYNVLAYNGIALIPGPSPSDSSYQYWNTTLSRYEIPNFDPDSLELFMKPATQNTTSASFTYTWRDTAGVEGATGSYSIGAILPLDVQLISFQAVRSGEKAVLSWMVAAEKDIKQYEIQYAQEPSGAVWTPVSQVQPKSGSLGVKQYQTEDKLREGLTWYRLAVTETNGKTLYYGPVMFNHNSTLNYQVNLFPNPIQQGGSAVIDVKGTISAQHIRVMDLNGKVVFNYHLEQESNQVMIPTEMLSQGIYLINLNIQGEWVNLKLMVN